ncbi:GatB/YqeY domain-containing protein [Longirhabdus pacifica]|uniref:GatB/YqeY domain-containing protein n=1 Tax=Longirhabdus pacifica TaxID=2305227 RepID=UPI00100895A1|nr:GatB/YqeY domain-containing protein [Longirhabdus pacifica]
MSLNERLTQDMKLAMKSQDKFTLSVIRMLRAAVKNVEINNGQGYVLTDDEVLDVLNRELKQRKESLQEFENAGRTDLVEKITKELDIITQYLPAQLSEEEIKEIVQQTIQGLGVSSKKEMGKVMSALMPKVKGRADGKLVNQLVQQHLQ